MAGALLLTLSFVPSSCAEASALHDSCGSTTAALVRLSPKSTMTWISIVPRGDADAALGAAYDAVSGARGTVANIMGVHSMHPEAMTAHLRLYQELMFAPSELTRVERETVAVTVSRANDCFY